MSEQHMQLCRDASGPWQWIRDVSPGDTTDTTSLEHASAHIRKMNKAHPPELILALWEAATPGPSPCDCCILQDYGAEQFWRYDCQCGNRDDSGEAAAWCRAKNKFARVEKLCTAETD